MAMKRSFVFLMSATVLISLFSVAWAQETDHHHNHTPATTSVESPGILQRLFQEYVPRQVCMNYESDVIATHVAADLLIAAAYYSIPLGLSYFVRRRVDLAYHWMFWLFAAFIFFCGTTHIFSVIAIWHPFYRLDGIIKLMTGFVSVATAVLLWPIIPKALMLPSPAQLEQRVMERTAELQAEVTARTAAEVREREARSQAEFANRAKDEFLATLSHELRTPINAILGWTQIVQRGNFNPDDTRDAMEVIERNARAQAQLIEELLDMSRIISGKLRLEMQATDINKVIETAAATIEPGAKAKGLKVEFRLQKNIPAIQADPYRMQQVIWNLLSNALKFTPTGGTITISSRTAPSENGQVQVWVDVADTGIGVEPEFLPRIFDRFSQADSGSNRRFGGLGLGLAIVRHLVELHGGNITAASPGTNRGATFSIRLPAISTPAWTAASQSREMSPGAADLRGIRILLVDDQRDTLMAIQRLLRDSGAEVVTAESAAEALAAIEKAPPTVILSDIGLPGEDGYSLIRRVRQLPPEQGGQTPAVAITAFVRAEDRVKALNAGFQMHLAKPVDAAELVATVAALVREKK